MKSVTLTRVAYLVAYFRPLAEVCAQYSSRLRIRAKVHCGNVILMTCRPVVAICKRSLLAPASSFLANPFNPHSCRLRTWPRTRRPRKRRRCSPGRVRVLTRSCTTRPSGTRGRGGNSLSSSCTLYGVKKCIIHLEHEGRMHAFRALLGVLPPADPPAPG